MTKPTPPQPDPLAREVDRLLAQLERGSPPTSQSTAPRPIVTPKSVPAISSKVIPSRRSLVALWARVLLGFGLGALMTQWPYPNTCGLPLAGYFGAVAMVMLSGAWIGFESWKLRRGLPHILSLILFFWGIVLAAEQVLPRIGYAAVSAGWGCLAGGSEAPQTWLGNLR